METEESTEEGATKTVLAGGLSTLIRKKKKKGQRVMRKSMKGEMNLKRRM